MRILISNDDGYRSAGINCLNSALSEMAETTVVAPDRDRSGASNSLTLDQPLRVNLTENGFYAVNGTPTDCVHLAITGLLDEEPDMVVSGINNGANLGDDVLYSGTVAAAMEGRFLGLPTIAISLMSHRPTHFETAARVAQKLVAQLGNAPLDANTILNVNVPDLPWQQLAGFKVTRLGHRHKAEAVIRAQDPRGRDIYWIGPAAAEQDAGPGTDFYAINANFVSITPLQVDLTNHSRLETVREWVAKIEGRP